jgi:hypothetical protein
LNEVFAADGVFRFENLQETVLAKRSQGFEIHVPKACSKVVVMAQFNIVYMASGNIILLP